MKRQRVGRLFAARVIQYGRRGVLRVRGVQRRDPNQAHADQNDQRKAGQFLQGRQSEFDVHGVCVLPLL